MDRLRAFLSKLLLHAMCAIGIGLGVHNAALAQITPLNLALSNDNTITLSMQGQSWPLHLNHTFNLASPTPFHLTGTIGNDPLARVALTVHQWPNDVVGSLFVDGQWYQVESNLSATRMLGQVASDSALIAIQPDVNLTGQYGLHAIDHVLTHQSLAQPLSNASSIGADSNSNSDSDSDSVITIKRTETNNTSNKEVNTTRRTRRALRVGIVVDSLFNEHHGGRGMARATSIMNGVDSILQNELGLAIEVVHVVDYTTPSTDPFRTLQPNINTVIMPELQRLRVENADLPSDLSLVHLFSGHKHQTAVPVIGLSWLNSVCNRNGLDVSLSTPFLFDTLLAAHEIMHNLGAPHDDSEQCQAYSSTNENNLMWPKISAGTTSTLSACSVDSVSASSVDNCAVNTLDMGIDLEVLTQTDAINHTLTLTITNTDVTRNAPDAVSHTLLPANTTILSLPASCQLDEATLVCNHEPIAPSQQTQTRLVIDTRNSLTRRVRSEVLLNTNVDRNRLNNVAILNLPTAEFSDDSSNNNTLVTVSTNNTSNNTTTGLVTNSTLINDELSTTSLGAFTQPDSSRSGFSRFGATSMGAIWIMLLLAVYRLVITINRIKRNRL